MGTVGTLVAPPRAASVSVVIPTHGRPALLRRCLAALLEQDYPPAALEIVVVEDGGPAGAERVARELSDAPVPVRYLPVPRGGPAAARNAGWRAASGELIAFTDDDTIPRHDWIRRGVESIRAGADAVAGRTLVPLPPRPTDAQRNTGGLERASFATCNAFCRREVLERIGGFDPRFTRAYREDSDLEFTLVEAGARVVRDPSAVVAHPPRAERPFASLRQQRNQLFDALLYREHPALFRRHIRAAPPWRYYAIAAAQLASLLCLLVGRPRPALVATALWSILAGRFCLERLSGASRRPAHVAEMAITSALIPPVAVFWRLYGAWKFRVLFL